MYEIKDITYFYKPGMSRGLKIASYNLPWICMFQNIETKNPLQIKQYIYIMFVSKI